MSFPAAGQFDRLLCLISAAITHRQKDLFHDLQMALRKHRPDFLNLLKNPPKSAMDNQKVKKAANEGIPLQGETRPRRLPPQVIEEALLLSDLVEINEFRAVELLLSGERLLPQYPGLSRGLVAVLLYHEERRNLAQALRSLIQAREGTLWTLDLGEEMTDMIMTFTEDLIKNGLMQKVLSLLESINVQMELAKLEKGRAIGGEKHRQQLTALITEQRLALAECVYCWACQGSPSQEDVLSLLDFLKMTPAERMEAEDATLDPVYLSLFLALLHCLNVEPLREMQTDEEEEEFYDGVELFNQEGRIEKLHEKIVGGDEEWEFEELGAGVKLIWSLVLCIGSRHPGVAGAVDQLNEDDEAVFYQAVVGGALNFFRKTIIGAPVFFSEEFYVRRIHGLVTGVLVNMPLRVRQLFFNCGELQIKRLRNENDEAARIITVFNQKGAEPPEDLRHDFEDLMKLVHDLYVNSSLQLEIEYWAPIGASLSTHTSSYMASSYSSQSLHRHEHLNRFVRLAGDSLPASLFAPYVNMLCGLSSSQMGAQYCYTLLKSNCPSFGAASANSTISWDHFFASMKHYYSNMRQDVTSASGRAPIHSLVPATISPQEIEGLQAVLRLLEQIIKQDSVSGSALCNSQEWLPVPTLLGLLSSPVPPQLKANLLLCLAAFARTPDIATNMWHSLELHQILQTVTTSHGTTQQGGIKIELEEIESRNEEYPQTRAFLTLLGNLMDSPILPGLGAGYRSPGFDPYLEFLRDSVFLKFNTRAYGNADEKWMVCADVLNVLHKLLEQYEPMESHLIDQLVEVQSAGTEKMQKPPGYTIMLHLLNESPMFQKIMYVINTGAQHVLHPVKMSTEGQKALERSVLLALQMIEIVLSKETLFIEFLRDNNAPELATPLEQLLFSINMSTNLPDLYLNIARFVCEHDMNLELALTAVQILCAVSRTGPIQKDLVGVLTSQEASCEILHGFVARLGSSEPELSAARDADNDEDNQGVNDEATAVQLASSIRQKIICLLLVSLHHRAPTVAHFLLGFELMKPPSQTHLQDPGVRGSPRTCLHVALDVLNEHVAVCHSARALVPRKPRLVELCYQLVHTLASNPDTSQPTVRYLRSSYDFFCHHLESIPFPSSSPGGKDMGDHDGEEDDGDGVDGGESRLIKVMNHHAWLLKSLALELRLTSLNKQHSHTQRIVALLLSESSSSSVASRLALKGDAFTLFLGSQSSGPGRKRILRLLDEIDLTQECPPDLDLQFFDVNLVSHLIQALEEQQDSELATCNIKELHKTLLNELNSSQGITSLQRPEVVKEIKGILRVALDYNRIKERMVAKKEFLIGWQQLTEILLTACPIDLFDGERKRAFVFEMIQEILLKVSGANVSPHLSSPLHGVILVLMAQIRPARQVWTPGHVSGSSLPAGTLHSILRGVLENVMASGTGQLNVRSRLYAALLYYLQSTNNSGQQESSDLSVVFGVTGGVESQGNLQSGNLAILANYGEALMERICRDACDGTGIIQMLAFAVLDSIVPFDWQNKWLNHLTLKGYLKHSVNSLVHNDVALQAALAPNPEPLKALYIYESKMAFLTRLAQSSTGAQALFHCGLLLCLPECSFLGMRPETAMSGTVAVVGEAADEGYSGLFQDSFLPAVAERYRQLFFPALKLILAMQNSLGKRHQEASLQVLALVTYFSEVFFSVLKGNYRPLILSSLEELALVTGIVCRVAVGVGQTAGSSPELLTTLSRLRRLMLSLLSQYCLPDTWNKIVKAVCSFEGRDVEEAALQHLQTTCSNVVTYCRHAVCGGSYSSKFRLATIILEPLLVEESRQRVTSSFRLPTVGLLIRHLQASCDNCLADFEACQLYKRKLGNMAELSSEEMREYAQTEAPIDKLTAPQREELARIRLEELVENRKQQTNNYHYIIENSLYVLWSHMEFFYIHCKPKLAGEDFMSGFSMEHKMRQLQHERSDRPENQCGEPQPQLGSGITRATLKTFKSEAGTYFPEIFFKKLTDVEATQGGKRLIQALSKRIKRLLKLQS